MQSKESSRWQTEFTCHLSVHANKLQPTCSQPHFLSKMHDILRKQKLCNIVIFAGGKSGRLGRLFSSKADSGPILDPFSIFRKTGNGCRPCIQTTNCFTQAGTSDAPVAGVLAAVRLVRVSDDPKPIASQLAINGVGAHKIAGHNGAYRSTPNTH